MFARAAPLVSLDRRPASVAAIDARLSVWGHAARKALQLRAVALCDGAALFAERHGRAAMQVGAAEAEPVEALLGIDAEPLGQLAAALLPDAIRGSCRILWVDPVRLTGTLLAALEPDLRAAKLEIRRQQAQHRRRARLWRDDHLRLDGLRVEVEGLSVPRGGPTTVQGVLDVLERSFRPAMSADGTRTPASG